MVAVVATLELAGSLMICVGSCCEFRTMLSLTVTIFTVLAVANLVILGMGFGQLSSLKEVGGATCPMSSSEQINCRSFAHSFLRLFARSFVHLFVCILSKFI
jgi:hypothetical protein